MSAEPARAVSVAEAKAHLSALRLLMQVDLDTSVVIAAVTNEPHTRRAHAILSDRLPHQRLDPHRGLVRPVAVMARSTAISGPEVLVPE
jgi:hypothetical protein